MNPDRWQQIKTILDAAAEMPADDRQAVIDEACEENPELRQDVEAFLEIDGEVADFIEDPLWSLNPEADDPVDESNSWGVGRRVGPYRIQRSIGRGGMGTVFLAVREDDYEQKVAVKVLSWGMSSEEVLGRFYNERQILASLEHPSIARLLDGGTTDDGLPYLVMEYVEGERIDRYCERHDLPVRERLDLFRQVCAAVQYAHRNLIVHRDLKASNILVNDDGKVRLLDFGIAKLLEPHLAFHKVATLPGHAPMTPAYASPEQVLNDPITTACDVYALGVLLYRLLTGLPPYRLEGTSYPEMVKIICFREPEKPSTVARFDVAALQDKETTKAGTPSLGASEADSAQVLGRSKIRRRKLAGDLDAIVLKAMRKEPEHRYGSAAELSEDIRRHLVGLPVLARKGNWFYFTTKFLRRNKLALAAVLLILAFAVTATVLWREAVAGKALAEQERARAEVQEARAGAVRTFLEELLSEAGPDAGGGADLTAHEILERGLERLTTEDLASAPEDSAEILGTIGTVYLDWGEAEKALEPKKLALQVRRASDPSARPELAKDVNGLAVVLFALGRYQEAEPYFREAIAMWKGLGRLDGEVVTAIFNRAATLKALGRLEESRDLFAETLDLRRELFGEDSLEYASSLYGLGGVYADLGEFEAAEEPLRRALQIRIDIYGTEDNTRVARVLSSLGRMLHAKGDFDGAREVLEKALAIRTKLFREEDRPVLDSKNQLASLLLDQGEVARAGALIDDVFRALGEPAPAEDRISAGARGLRGRYLQALRRFEEAEPYLLESYRFVRDSRGEESRRARRLRDRVAEFYTAWGKPDKAAEYLG